MKLRKFPQVMAFSNRKKREVSEAEKRLLDERWKNYLKNPGSALTPEQFEDLLAKERKLLDERMAEHAAHPEDTLTPQKLREAVESLLK